MKFLRLLRERTAGTPAQAAETAAGELAPATLAADFQKTQGRDQLTGLPNRTCFAHLTTVQSDMARAWETPLSLLVVSWDGYANASAGRDAHMVAIAAQLRGALRRAHDVLGSLGEGRFGVLLPFTNALGAEQVARNLQAAMPGKVTASGQEAGTLLNFGVASYVGRGALAEGGLLAAAEQGAAFASLNGERRIVRYGAAAADAA